MSTQASMRRLNIAKHFSARSWFVALGSIAAIACHAPSLETPRAPTLTASPGSDRLVIGALPENVLCVLQIFPEQEGQRFLQEFPIAKFLTSPQAAAVDRFAREFIFDLDVGAEDNQEDKDASAPAMRGHPFLELIENKPLSELTMAIWQTENRQNHWICYIRPAAPMSMAEMNQLISPEEGVESSEPARDDEAQSDSSQISTRLLDGGVLIGNASGVDCVVDRIEHSLSSGYVLRRLESVESAPVSARIYVNPQALVDEVFYFSDIDDFPYLISALPEEMVATLGSEHAICIEQGVIGPKTEDAPVGKLMRWSEEAALPEDCLAALCVAGTTEVTEGFLGLDPQPQGIGFLLGRLVSMAKRTRDQITSHKARYGLVVTRSESMVPYVVFLADLRDLGATMKDFLFDLESEGVSVESTSLGRSTVYQVNMDSMQQTVAKSSAANIRGLGTIAFSEVGDFMVFGLTPWSLQRWIERPDRLQLTTALFDGCNEGQLGGRMVISTRRSIQLLAKALSDIEWSHAQWMWSDSGETPAKRLDLWSLEHTWHSSEVAFVYDKGSLRYQAQTEGLTPLALLAMAFSIMPTQTTDFLRRLPDYLFEIID